MNCQRKEEIPISVIIPVYNVADWLDVCIESVVKQTFAEFEVILVDDGSDDGSQDKGRQWAQNDSRIKVIAKKNEGPSKARNRGLSEAKGKYVVFVDADDWLDARYLELMYRRAVETEADIVECDVFRVNNETGKRNVRVSSGVMGVDDTLEAHMKYGYTAIWKCMFNKELFTKHNVIFPDCHSEARAVYALLLALSGRIENVHEPLYYYRTFRRGSLTSKPRSGGEDRSMTGVQAFEHLLAGFRQCGLYAKYEKLLQEIVTYKMSDLLAAFFPRRKAEDYRRLAGNYELFLAQRFPAAPKYRYLTWGGYNLNRILCNMNLLHDPYCRFNFSSIISLMHPVQEEMICHHKNRYREIMLNREISGMFWQVLEEMAPDFLFVDFLEERFDIVACNGGYLTKSDAFDGADCPIEGGRTIARGTKECESLWRESCLAFIRQIEARCPSVRLVLVENYLSEQKGDIHGQEPFENLEEIRSANKLLKSYYSFFRENCQDLLVVEAWKSEYYFTDEKYEHGAIPSHLNEIANREIAGMAEREIGIWKA